MDTIKWSWSTLRASRSQMELGPPRGYGFSLGILLPILCELPVGSVVLAVIFGCPWETTPDGME